MALTNEELREIEARKDPADVPLLAAEVRRLRVVVEAARKFLDARRRFDHADVEKGRRYEEMRAAEGEFEARVGPAPGRGTAGEDVGGGGRSEG